MAPVSEDPAVNRLAHALYVMVAAHCADFQRRAELFDSMSEHSLDHAPEAVRTLFCNLALSGLAHTHAKVAK